MLTHDRKRVKYTRVLDVKFVFEEDIKFCEQDMQKKLALNYTIRHRGTTTSKTMVMLVEADRGVLGGNNTSLEGDLK